MSHSKLGKMYYHSTVILLLASLPYLLFPFELYANDDPAFVHPGISHTQLGLAKIRSKIAAREEPCYSAWLSLGNSDYASLDWQPRPRAHVERGARNHPNIGSSDFTKDSRAAYSHALCWALSGKEEHAAKAAEIINAWSYELKSIGNHDAKLLVGMEGIRYCNAAELIRHTWNGWNKADQQQFRSMLVNVLFPIIKDFYPSANGNWDASMLQTMIAMGVYLDDRTMFDRAVNYYLEGPGNGAIGNYFNHFGECQETGRDQTHTQMGLEFLANTCEVAWIQGVDLYGAKNNRLLLGFEYTAKYNLGYEVPYEPFKSYEGRYHYKSISDESRGKLRPMYERVYNHYHNRLELRAEYTRKATMKIRNRSRMGAKEAWDILMFSGLSNSSDKSTKTVLRAN